MYRLSLFLRKVYVGVIFIILESLAIHFYSNSTTYTQAKLLTVSNKIVGGTQAVFTGFGNFFRLGNENRMLTQRIAQLENQVSAYKQIVSEKDLQEATNSLEVQYEYIAASIINNTLTHQKNYITINKGFADGVSDGMAVLTTTGCMVGYVLNCSEKYSICMSILNTDFRASGHPLRCEEFGSISWRGSNRRYVTLSEFPKYTKLNKGDTIVSTPYSFYFPEGVMIGTVDKVHTTENSPSATVRVRLAADMMTVNKVILVRNRDANEIMDLQNSVEQTDKK